MSLTYQQSKDTLTVGLAGDFLHYDVPVEKQTLYDLSASEPIQKIVVQNNALGQWDSSLVVVLYQLAQIAKKKNIPCQWVDIPAGLRRLIDLALAVDRQPPSRDGQAVDWLTRVGDNTVIVLHAVRRGLAFMGQTAVSFGRLIAGNAVMRPVDFGFALEACGPKALGIVTLISFMVGLILAFVGAIQLLIFGAQIYVASLVTIAMIRIMGAIMVGIIMAGRTGASYAATIGTMQVNEEVDALRTMGVPITDFLVLPRVIALMITMPLLTMLADFMGMAGGMFVGVMMLDIAPEEYWKYAWDAFGLQNFLVGVFHGWVFGFIIALCGCYYGVHCGRNADSVGVATTKAVVSAIVWMIVITGLITVVCEALGV